MESMTPTNIERVNMIINLLNNVAENHGIKGMANISQIAYMYQLLQELSGSLKISEGTETDNEK